jgi:hypothetical protein
VKTLLQKIKIECSTVGLAERIRMELNNQ